MRVPPATVEDLAMAVAAAVVLTEMLPLPWRTPWWYAPGLVCLSLLSLWVYLTVELWHGRRRGRRRQVPDDARQRKRDTID